MQDESAQHKNQEHVETPLCSTISALKGNELCFIIDVKLFFLIRSLVQKVPKSQRPFYFHGELKLQTENFLSEDLWVQNFTDFYPKSHLMLFGCNVHPNPACVFKSKVIIERRRKAENIYQLTCTLSPTKDITLSSEIPSFVITSWPVVKIVVRYKGKQQNVPHCAE